jgi:hypothetical protein
MDLAYADLELPVALDLIAHPQVAVNCGASGGGISHRSNTING